MKNHRAKEPEVLRILIVEDDADAASVLSLWLQHRGHDVVVVGYGSCALEVLAAGSVTLVLCDISLPDMSGYELARRIRDGNFQSDVCLIAMSGCSQPEDRRKSSEAGFDQHLAKPFDMEVLTAVIDRLAGLRRTPATPEYPRTSRSKQR